MNAAKVCVEAAALCWIENHPGLAGWLQAVFSVLAIIVALTIPFITAAWSERSAQRRLHRRAEFAINYADEVAVLLANTMAKPHPFVGEPRATALKTDIFDRAQRQIDHLPVLDFTDQRVAASLSVISGIFSDLASSHRLLFTMCEADVVEQAWPTYIRDKVSHLHELTRLLRSRLLHYRHDRAWRRGWK